MANFLTLKMISERVLKILSGFGKNKVSSQGRSGVHVQCARPGAAVAVIIKVSQLRVGGRVELVGWKMCRPSPTLHLGITARGNG